MAEFTPLRREPSLVTRLTEQLLALMADGELEPGDVLPSARELGEQFGVSRTVIREALQQLQARGVVEVDAGRAARVAAVSARHVSDTIGRYVQAAQAQNVIQAWHISEVRETLELRLAELAAGRISDAEIHEMESELERMSAAPTAHEAALHDEAFHRLIAQATHNPLYVTLLESIAAAMLPIRERSLAVGGRATTAFEQHADILAGLKLGDAAAATAAMRVHLEDSRQYYPDPADRQDGTSLHDSRDGYP